MSEVEETTIDQLTPDENNANEGTERGRYLLDYSLRQFGAGRSILVDKNGKILAGNKTIEAAADIGLDDVILVHSRGDKIVAVMRDDLDLDEDEEARLLAYADNRASEVGLAWGAEPIQADLDQGLDLSGMFQTVELQAIGVDVPEGGNGGPTESREGSLAEQFVVPPFSVLDARQGYWQERKRAWLALGIRGELGRGENILYTSGDPLLVQKAYRGGLLNQIDVHPYDGQKRAWANSQNSVANITERVALGKATTESRVKIAGVGTGTSIFDPVLCELAYRWFCPPGGRVLDFFAGGSVRGIVAAWLGREYVGIDLSQPQIDANLAQAKEIGPGE